ERQVAARDRAQLDRQARLLGALRLQQRRRSLEGRALRVLIPPIEGCPARSPRRHRGVQPSPIPVKTRSGGASRKAPKRAAHQPPVSVLEAPGGAPYIIPPMSGMPAPTPAPAFSGASATIASVVRMFFAIDAAFCSAERVTIVGSVMPALTRSVTSPVSTLR